MKNLTPWIVTGKNGAQGLCQRCGETFHLELPVNLQVWLAASRAFVKAHARCQPRAEVSR